jgi:hypothetical protein
LAITIPSDGSLWLFASLATSAAWTGIATSPP